MAAENSMVEWLCIICERAHPSVKNIASYVDVILHSSKSKKELTKTSRPSCRKAA